MAAHYATNHAVKQSMFRPHLLNITLFRACYSVASVDVWIVCRRRLWQNLLWLNSAS